MSDRIFKTSLVVFILIIMAFMISGCTPGSIPGATLANQYGGTPPLVTARESGTAMMTIIACPYRPEGGALVSEMMQALAQQAPVVTASESGTARLILNTCPSPPDAAVVRELARLPRR